MSINLKLNQSENIITYQVYSLSTYNHTIIDLEFNKLYN